MNEVVRAGSEHAGVVGRMPADFNAEFAAPGPPAGEFAERLERLLPGDDLVVLLAGDPAAPTGLALLTLRDYRMLCYLQELT